MAATLNIVSALFTIFVASQANVGSHRQIVSITPPLESGLLPSLSTGINGKLPTGWVSKCINPALCPNITSVPSAAHGGSVGVLTEGNGRLRTYGWIEANSTTPLLYNKTYCLTANLYFENLPGTQDLQRHARISIVGDNFSSGVMTYKKTGSNNLAKAYRKFRFGWPKPYSPPAGEKGSLVLVKLVFKYAPQGRIYWRNIKLEQCLEEPERIVRVATTWKAAYPKWHLEWYAYWSKILDKVGSQGVDLVLLPEAFNSCGGPKTFECAEKFYGPSAKLLQQKASQWKMLTAGTVYSYGNTNDTDVVYNTAYLYGRNGELIGTHRKNVLYDPEEFYGVSPGMDMFPVYDTDIGKIGMITCYESWFPATTQVLALQGAEIILFPSAGFDPALMPARAADNGVWIVAASEGSYVDVWDSAGSPGGKKLDPVISTGTSFTNYTRNIQDQYIIADFDISMKWSPDWNSGDMMSAPGGRRARYTGIVDIEEDIHGLVHEWWENVA